MRRILPVIVLFFLFGVVLPVFAEEVGVDVTAHELEPVTVSAKKQRNRSVGEENEPVYSQYAVPQSAKISTEVIDRQEIEAINPTDFYDLISRAAGVDTSFQGRKIMNFASIRGGDGFGIIIDGFYIPSAQASRILAQFPMDAIESVRIVRDSTSLTLGPITGLGSYLSAPNQGFVILKTRRGTKPVVGMIGEYGSYDTYEGQLYHGNRIGLFDYRLTGTLSGTSGREGWHNAQNGKSVLFSGGYDGPSFKVNSLLYYERGMREMQRFNSLASASSRDQKWSYDPLQALWGALNVNKLWNSGQVTSFSYSHGSVTDKEIQASFNTSKVTYNNQGDHADDYHLWHTATFGGNTLKAGAQGTWWHEPSGYASYDGKEREETLFGAYAQDEQRLMEDRLTFDAAIRADEKYINKGVDKYSPTQTTTALIRNKWSSPVVAAGAGAAYKLDDIHTAAVRIGYSYAETDSFLATLNNKSLDPEERYKFELSLEGRYHPSFNPKLTLFYYNIRNYKSSVGQSGTGNNVVNIYDAFNVDRRGLEFSTDGSLPYGFRYNLNYSHIEYTRPDIDSTNPSDTLALLIGHRYGPLQTNLSIMYLSPYLNNRFASDGLYHEVGDFTRLDANVSYDYRWKNLQGRITAYARNLLNDHYQTVLTFENVGFTCGVRLEQALSL
jgi:outer membrane cobalamin receptor